MRAVSARLVPTFTALFVTGDGHGGNAEESPEVVDCLAGK
jgi:hypothetical protein